MKQLQEQFKQAMGRFGAGVCVVTYQKPSSGQLGGVTISAFSSLSLEPTKILFCLGNWGHSYQEFKEVTEFTVNILSAEQADICYQFAGKDLNGVDEHIIEIDGLPALKNTLATVVCDKGNQYVEGDHDIVIGNVRHVELDESGLQPLFYYKSKIIEDYQHVE